MNAWPCPVCGGKTALVSVYRLLWSCSGPPGHYAAARCANEHHSTVSTMNEDATLASFIDEVLTATGVHLPIGAPA